MLVCRCGDQNEDAENDCDQTWLPALHPQVQPLWEEAQEHVCPSFTLFQVIWSVVMRGFIYWALVYSKRNFRVVHLSANDLVWVGYDWISCTWCLSHDGLPSSRCSDDTAFGKLWCSVGSLTSSWSAAPPSPSLNPLFPSAETSQLATLWLLESADHSARLWGSTCSKWQRRLEPRSSSRSFRCLWPGQLHLAQLIQWQIKKCCLNCSFVMIDLHTMSVSQISKCFVHYCETFDSMLNIMRESEPRSAIHEEPEN